VADLNKSQNEIKSIDQEIDPRRDGHEHSLHPDLTTREVHRGKHQGDKYVRVIRSGALRRIAPGILRASEAVSRPQGRIGNLYTRFKQILVGKPLPMAAESHERLNKIRALGVFSTDAISSSAYATEEILLALVVAGAAGMIFSVPVSLGIAILLAIVSFSYRQTVHAYAQGGGSYTVSRENLGTQIGLIAAAALLIDYVMTVAVSVSAGTAAVTSAIQPLYPYRVESSVGLVAFITLINLRGVRESGTIFAIPTYLFIFSLASVIALGLVRILTGDLSQRAPHIEPTLLEPMTFLLALRAFASGSVAMSGTEAIANGIPAFQPPESKNAATTLTVMSTILGVFFVGVTFLSHYLGIVPLETETVISQVGRTVLGNDLLYGIFQISTMLILVLGANTSFSGFPRLAYVLAQDGFMPHQLKFRGDRLAFSNGIVILGTVAAVLIVGFGGSTHALIPLYAVGVFLSFTCSQAGMVRHWWKVRERNWQRSAIINGTGAILTASILIVVWAVKFQQGAWIVFLMIPLESVL
jgi:amino acid transporter